MGNHQQSVFSFFSTLAVFWHFFNRNHRKSSSMCFYIIFFAVGMILLLHSGWGWGNSILRYHLYIFHICILVCHIFDLFFDPIWETSVYQPNFNFLEMAHTNFFSSIRKTAYQPFILVVYNEHMLSNFHFPKLYF